LEGGGGTIPRLHNYQKIFEKILVKIILSFLCHRQPNKEVSSKTLIIIWI
jgi:hypothetical protein